MKFPQTGNKIWYNRAFLYYHRVDNDADFVREMYYIMKESGLIPERKQNP